MKSGLMLHLSKLSSQKKIERVQLIAAIHQNFTPMQWMNLESSREQPGGIQRCLSTSSAASIQISAAPGISNIQ